MAKNIEGEENLVGDEEETEEEEEETEEESDGESDADSDEGFGKDDESSGGSDY